MFRKDHQARTEWNEGAVELCATRQLEILTSIWSALKTNGYLIYSTCTFNETENEKTIQALCQQFDCEIVSINADPFIKGRNGIGHYAFPHKLDTEGFYICVVQRKGQASKIWKNKSKHKSKKIAFSALRNLLPPALSSLEYFNDKELIQWQDFLFAVPKIHAERVLDFQSCLKIIKMGTEVGTIMNQKLIPNHALALDESLFGTTEPIELEKEQALNYLKGDTFPLEGKKGFQLVSYLGVNLGWINHLGNRFNNLYPKEWRIRMKID
jgi:NOL1/NOP2/fmu family ribosome biogenesis protein